MGMRNGMWGRITSSYRSMVYNIEMETIRNEVEINVEPK